MADRIHALVLVAAAMACGPQVQDGAADGSESGAPTSEPLPEICEPTEHSTCKVGISCEHEPCNDPLSPYDANGCLRERCPCAEGQVCLHPLDWGRCASSDLSCSPSEQGCSCFGTADCSGSFCVPEAEVPPGPCLSIVDADECDTSGCLWIEAIRKNHVDDCACVDPDGVCVQPVSFVPGPATAYTNYGSLVFIVDGAFDPVPIGLYDCSVPGVPTCECATAAPCA